MNGQGELVTNDPVDLGKLPIESWWRHVSEDDLQATLVKLGEYGSNDLVEIGRVMAQLSGWTGLDEREMAELGCFFYLVGKVSRMAEAFTEHRWPSDDSWKDTAVYATMVRRIRDHGKWG